MKIYKNLYVSESLHKPAKQRKIKKKLSANKRMLKLYIITNSTSSEELLDIYNYGAFFYPFGFKHFDLTIYGVASDKDEAMELVSIMMEDCFKETGSYDLKTFLNMQN